MKRGRYIVIEGTDGTGKNTQVDLLKDWLRTQHVPVLEQDISEPAGTLFADAVRTVIKDGSLPRDALANLLLFNAARRSIYFELIAPAIERGDWVITARNYLSSLVYQGYAEGMNREEILKRVTADTAPEYMSPDLTIVLDIDSHAIRTARIGKRGQLEKPDTFEMREAAFQDKILAGYRAEARLLGYPLISAEGTKQEISATIIELVQPLLVS